MGVRLLSQIIFHFLLKSSKQKKKREKYKGKWKQSSNHYQNWLLRKRPTWFNVKCKLGQSRRTKNLFKRLMVHDRPLWTNLVNCKKEMLFNLNLGAEYVSCCSNSVTNYCACLAVNNLASVFISLCIWRVVILLCFWEQFVGLRQGIISPGTSILLDNKPFVPSPSRCWFFLPIKMSLCMCTLKLFWNSAKRNLISDLVH